MSKTIDIKIGTRILYGHVTLLVQGTPNNAPICYGCFFSDFFRQKHGLPQFNCCNHRMECGRFRREDRTNVVFIKL